jgi:hypothetical protein
VKAQSNLEKDSTVPPIIEDQEMHYCQMEFQGPVVAFCDDRATAKIEGRWYCQHHADALEQASERWSGVNWFPLRHTESDKQLQLDDDGRCWDDED